MFIRYHRDKNGKLVQQAVVYTEKEHGIARDAIDSDAIKVIERLKEAGFKAFIVGGAVRDLLRGKTPKDFDLVTDAIPARIKKLFRNSRIIGRRFRLVHIYYGDTIFEVSTFRSIVNGSVGNEFGTIDEDVMRRDFTINALYFDPIENIVVDYVGGFNDVREGFLKPIIPLADIFVEDPVRMVRGIKYAITASCSIPPNVQKQIRKDAQMLAGVSPSRMTEEFFKILASGKSAEIIQSLCHFKLFEYFVPRIWEKMEASDGYRRALFADLIALDAQNINLARTLLQDESAEAANQGKKSISVLLSYLLKGYVSEHISSLKLEGSGGMPPSEVFRTALLDARAALMPLNPPRVELEAAMLMIFKNLGISPLRKPERKRRSRKPVSRQGERLLADKEQH